jgi:uncharacterized lipoprotein YmbA
MKSLSVSVSCLLFAFFCVAATGCGSVEVPAEHYYRLAMPEAATPDPMRAGVLRVADLHLGTAVDGDSLMQQTGNRLQPRPLARWVAPLDRLVTESLVLGLSRARVCDLVKGSADAGSEHWVLHGRIVDFVELVDGGRREARVTLELWLEEGARLVFHDEFLVAETVADGSAEAAVAALSRGVGTVVDRVVARMRGLELFAAVRSSRAGPEAAVPGR